MSQKSKLHNDSTAEPTGSAISEHERVGYKHPPRATRFKPGTSGNPSGRPKQVKSFHAELLEELGEPMRVRDGDAELEITKARAIAKELVGLATSGNLRAATALLAFFSRIGTDADGPEQVTPEDLAAWDDLIERKVRGKAANSTQQQTDSQE